MMDQNGDGRCSRVELAHFLQTLTDMGGRTDLLPDDGRAEPVDKPRKKAKKRKKRAKKKAKEEL